MNSERNALPTGYQDYSNASLDRVLVHLDGRPCESRVIDLSAVGKAVDGLLINRTQSGDERYTFDHPGFKDGELKFEVEDLSSTPFRLGYAVYLENEIDHKSHEE